MYFYFFLILVVKSYKSYVSLFTNNLYDTSGVMLPTRHCPIITQD